MTLAVDYSSILGTVAIAVRYTNHYGHILDYGI